MKHVLLCLILVAAAPAAHLAQTGQGGDLPDPSDKQPVIALVEVAQGVDCANAIATKTRFLITGADFLQEGTGALPVVALGNPFGSSPPLVPLTVISATNTLVCAELDTATPPTGSYLLQVSKPVKQGPEPSPPLVRLRG